MKNRINETRQARVNFEHGYIPKQPKSKNDELKKQAASFKRSKRNRKNTPHQIELSDPHIYIVSQTTSKRQNLKHHADAAKEKKYRYKSNEMTYETNTQGPSNMHHASIESNIQKSDYESDTHDYTEPYGDNYSSIKNIKTQTNAANKPKHQNLSVEHSSLEKPSVDRKAENSKKLGHNSSQTQIRMIQNQHRLIDNPKNALVSESQKQSRLVNTQIKPTSNYKNN